MACLEVGKGEPRVRKQNTHADCPKGHRGVLHDASNDCRTTQPQSDTSSEGSSCDRNAFRCLNTSSMGDQSLSLASLENWDKQVNMRSSQSVLRAGQHHSASDRAHLSTADTQGLLWRPTDINSIVPPIPGNSGVCLRDLAGKCRAAVVGVFCKHGFSTSLVSCEPNCGGRGCCSLRQGCRAFPHRPEPGTPNRCGAKPIMYGQKGARGHSLRLSRRQVMS